MRVIAASLLTTKQVAETLSVSPECVLRWWRAGRIGGYRLGGNGPLRFRPDDVEAFLEPGRRDAAAGQRGALHVSPARRIVEAP